MSTIAEVSKLAFMSESNIIPKITSLMVAEIFQKRHKNVLQAINNLECSAGFREQNFQPSHYINSQNKRQPMVLMTRDGFIFLVMGFTGERAVKFKIQLIEAFNKMEEEIRRIRSIPAPQTLREAIEQAIEQARQYADRLENQSHNDIETIDATFTIVDSHQQSLPHWPK